MCGLAGIIGPQAGWTRPALDRMTQAQRHRGPDGAGVEWRAFAAASVGLGHRRLAIQDLSEAGRQPMIDPETGDILIYNGEIYNAPELAAELAGHGVAFAGRSDTEVLLRALRVWGPEALPKVRGMYAFAWLDQRDGSVVLARDPLGIKPLYLARAGQHLLFASEVRALLASGRVGTALSPAGIAGFLAYGTPQAPQTILEDVTVFPAGCWQRIRLDRAISSADPPRPHWRFPAPDPRLRGPVVVEQVRETLTSAVRGHLVSDVPVGIFLSSGIDSTVVAGLAARQAERPMAFTVGFSDEKDHSEAELAADTARRFGIPHQVLWLSAADALGAIEPWLTSLDQPSMDGLNTYLVSKAVRQAGAVVALSGQGGDELFGGYSAFSVVPRLNKLLRWLRSLPPDARASLAAPLGLGRPSSFREKLRDVFRIGPDLVGLALQQRRAFSDRQIRQLVPQIAASAARDRHFLDRQQLADLPIVLDDPVHAVSLLECRYYLGHTLLPVGDATGMAHSLEIRVPMLDRAVLDLALSVPGEEKLPNGRADKALLRSAFPEFLRPELLEQKKKGFVIPVRRWMLGTLRPICEAALEAVREQPEFSAAGVDAIWDGFRNEPESSIWSRAWALVALGVYLRQVRGGGAASVSSAGGRVAV